ncbi:MAG: amino acid adenylation domain-containing protein [Candidatus Aminicenantes bacterium]|jgi:amino acid adenylation domain-containing protein
MNLLRGFSTSVEKYPQKPAVIVKNSHYTYSQMHTASDAIAYGLTDRGIGKNDFVGILMRKGAAAVASFLACLKVGAIYVPMDPRDPAERLKKIVENCSISTIICSQEPQDLNVEHVLVVSDLNEKFLRGPEAVFTKRGSATPTYSRSARCRTFGASSQKFVEKTKFHKLLVKRAPGRRRQDVAYVLHTSGSTGIPKGVQITHQNICNFIAWTGKVLNTTGSDVFGNHAPFIFDLSTLDIYGAFAVGGTVVLATEREMMDASLLVRNIKTHGITTWYSVPSILAAMVENSAWPEITSLRCIIFAGEPYPVNKIGKLLSSVPGHCELYNFYGPTETNVCTYYRVPHDHPPDQPFPIGKAIDESVKTEIKQEELVIHGPCVMKGYVGQPDLTEKIYATGDRVSMDEAGNLHLLGRKDNQVKIRGNRVELGEIENTILKWEKIEAVALTTEMKEGHKYLRAHVQLKKGVPKISLIQLKTFCRKTLPIYMVPHYMQLWEQLPRNQNGKIDRHFLGSDQWKAALKN